MITAAGRQVVVIDDDPSIQALFRDVLEGEGYRVATRGAPPADPADLLALAPDLVVLDLVVGRDGGGWAFLQRLKTDPATHGLPVLVCSAAVETVERHRAQLDTWCCGVLLKPFDLDDLLALVRACIDPGAAAEAC